MNCLAYGRLGLDYSCYRNYDIKPEEAFKSYIGPRMAYINKLPYTDLPVNYIEHVKRPKVKNDDRPIHVMKSIVDLAQLTLLKAVYDMADILDQKKFTVLYFDTDSIFIGICAETLNDIVLPGKVNEWERFNKSMFVSNNTCSKSRREIGKLKTEAEITTGSFIAVSCKQYMLFGESIIKLARKGVNMVKFRA